METFKDVNGKTKYSYLYSEGLMKQIGQLDGSIANEGVRLFSNTIVPAHEVHAKLNDMPVSVYSMIADVYAAGYLNGIRAERAKKKKK